jgi:O-antigen ligase
MILILLYILGARSLLISFFSERELILSNSDLFIEAVITENEPVRIIGQITTSLFLLIGVVGIMIGISYWRRNKLPYRGSLITVASLFLYTPVILSSIISGNGGFSYKLLFLPLFVIAAYLYPHLDLIRAVKNILPILLMFIYVSLLAMLLDPTWAYSSYSESWISLPIRLYGASNHPNGLGYIALSYLILARLNRKKSIWTYANYVAIYIVLILSQSKTTWIALVIWIVLEWIIKNVSIRRQLISRMLTTFVAVALLTMTYFLLFKQDFISSMINFDMTITGRINVWKITWDIWLKNPIFGYGPNLWDPSFRQQFHYLWAGHAHNQVLQTLGESGLIGILGLLFYLLVLIYLSSRYIDATNFASLGFVIMTLVRSFSETPLSIYDLNMSFLIQAMIFMIFVHAESLLTTPVKHTQATSIPESRDLSVKAFMNR